MAWDWLDAARYADTNGYQGDSERTMWPWRDWVVDAFNRNLPFDQFSTWQLAGDLLPDATTEQQLATGFCRNHMINGEGGRIADENRVDYVMDMSETSEMSDKSEKSTESKPAASDTTKTTSTPSTPKAD